MPGTHTIYSKNEFSGWFFFYPIKFAIKYRVPGTHTILQTAIFTTGYLSDYQTLISDVTGASDIAGMITALENISEDYDALGAEAKADINIGCLALTQFTTIHKNAWWKYRIPGNTECLALTQFTTIHKNAWRVNIGCLALIQFKRKN